MNFDTICFRDIEWKVPDIFLDHVTDALDKDLVLSEPASSTNRDSVHYSALLDGIDVTSKSIVDICSGFGNLDELARKVVRISRIDVVYAKKRPCEKRLLTDCPEKVEFQQGNAYNLPLGQNVADIVTETHGVTYHNPVLTRFLTYNGLFVQAVSERISHLGRVGREVITYFQSIAEKLRVVKKGGLIVIGPVAGSDKRNTYIYENLLKPTLDHWKEQKLIDWEPVEVEIGTCVVGRTYCRIRVLGDLSPSPSKYTLLAS